MVVFSLGIVCNAFVSDMALRYKCKRQSYDIYINPDAPGKIWRRFVVFHGIDSSHTNKTQKDVKGCCAFCIYQYITKPSIISQCQSSHTRIRKLHGYCRHVRSSVCPSLRPSVWLSLSTRLFGKYFQIVLKLGWYIRTSSILRITAHCICT